MTVQVIDTGLGIEKDRQQLLFKPFLELQQKQNLKLVKDNSIGLGLACSKEIVQQLHGDLKLVHSQSNLTVFEFFIPVRTQIKTTSMSPVSSFLNSDDIQIDLNLAQMFENQNDDLHNFLKSHKVFSAHKFVFADDLIPQD